MRFSIRDLLWATVVVAMGLGWWLSYQATKVTLDDLREQLETTVTEAAEDQRYYSYMMEKQISEIRQLKGFDP